MVVYLDNMLFFHQQKESLLKTKDLVLDLLENSESTPWYAKSYKAPFNFAHYNF